MEFGFRLQNYKHQQDEWDRHRDDDARALLWQMRTGKTKAVLDLACYRRLKGDIQAVLVIAPNGVHVNWIRRQLPQHMWETVPYVAHAWQASEAHKPEHAASLEKLLSINGQALAVLAVNSESIIHDKPAKIIRRFLKRHEGKVLLVVDESHDFRSPGSKRTKRARSLKRYCKVRRILTGTAVSNSPLAAYSQFELLSDHALGFQNFADFESHYAYYVQERTKGGRSYERLDHYRNLDDLQGRMAEWSSVVLREDVDDMPDLVMDERTVVLPEAMMKAYRTLLKEMILELEGGGEVEAIDGGARLVKLQQMLGGFVVDMDGVVRELVSDDENPRLQSMLEDVKESDRKCIVWCKYREDIRRVVRALTAAGIKCVEYHGAIHSQSKRQEAIDAFNDDPSVTVFVGQPKAGGQGLDLSAADLILWYSHTFDLIERDQANERATQIGGKTVTIRDYVTPGTVDEYILANLNQKRSVSESLAGRGLRDRLLALFRQQL
ncbi:putative helicase [Xanthomonas phage vB_Xar_IVIA-DoCa5]|uniref:Helicase n=1 Tax=Xanthomonas phage vB_Xar_IVIA-DoCa5 TaxID=2975532 RepID=A0A9X9NYT0_9CAUD|nr:putative helicase [Xanthomonas phage vB_Xar_IVIA-DoCa5]MCK9468851.1 DEAD/DEAH box helicase [Porticoccaceae bacterium]UYA98722.1 putative helicase [Xanthomonas phage vB_Xar_IVIA-DoCa5]